MRPGRRFLRLLAAQGLWLRNWPVVLLALGFAVLPLAVRWLGQTGALTLAGQYKAYQGLAECYLPLWALVAGAVVWSDAEPCHRPLLFPWPMPSCELALAKLLAVGIVYTLMAGVGALYLPALMARAGGQLSGGLVFLRALLSGSLLLALAALGSALSMPWVGMALWAALWFANLEAGTALWLDAHTRGALHLLAWVRGSHWPLAQVNVAAALAALGLLGVALAALGVARRRAQGRA